MNNGSNKWGVSFSRIAWLESVIGNHDNVTDTVRHDDIIIKVKRNSGPELTVICLDQYAFGVSAAERVFQEFPEVNFISVGGNWNGYTPEAKELCKIRNIGVYNSSELTGAIWKDEFWTYHQRDKDGNPVYHYKSA